ncbi:NAD(P)/FAD-dependent oxidoreductase, partial [Fusobacterium mortiferum]
FSTSSKFLKPTKFLAPSIPSILGINTKLQCVKLDNDNEIKYDKLLIASGSHSFIPKIDGIDGAKNLVGFRNFEDVEKIEEMLPNIKNIVIMGGGLVGIDAAAGLLHKDKNLYLVEMGDRMLPLQLDNYTASVYEKAFEKEGLKQYYSNGIASIENIDGTIKSVTLKSGEIIPCDLLISAAGIRANIRFLEGSEVACDNKGLLFNEKGETNISNIYGAGDVSGKSPIWPVAVKEGIIAAYNMSGLNKDMDDFFASKATMNFLDIPTMSLGITSGYDDSYTEEIELDNFGNYKKIVHKNGIIYGALLQGDLSYAGILTQLIRLKIDVSKVKKRLFDIDYSDFFHVTDNFEFTYNEVK